MGFGHGDDDGKEVTSKISGDKQGMLTRPSIRTRLVYCLIFMISAFVALLFRSYADSLLDSFSVITRSDWCQEGDIVCIGNLGVFRVAFSLATWHVLLAMALFGYTSDGSEEAANDFRFKLQNNYWCIKMTVYVLLFVATFWIPNQFFIGFAWVALFGAVFFLLLQVLLLLDFTWQINVQWLEQGREKLVVAAAVFLYLGGLIGIIFEYRWFAPQGQSCGLNIGMITLTLILGIAYTVISIASEHGWGILPSSMMFIYSSFVTYSAVNSHPNITCNTVRTETASASDTSQVIIGFAFAMTTIIYSCINVASKSDVLSNKADDDKPTVEEDQAGRSTYNFSYFHLIFCAGAMYTSMLFTGWQLTPSAATEQQETLVFDYGTNSFWAKLGSLWIAISLYIWTQIAPYILTNRDFS